MEKINIEEYTNCTNHPYGHFHYTAVYEVNGHQLKGYALEDGRIYLQGIGLIRSRQDGDNPLNVSALDALKEDKTEAAKPPVTLTKSFYDYDYPLYDNYLGWNVDKVKDIPIEFADDKGIIINIADEDYDKWKSVYGDDLEIVHEEDLGWGDWNHELYEAMKTEYPSYKL